MQKTARKPKSSITTKSKFQKPMVIARPDVLHTYLRYNQILQYLDYIEQKFSHFVAVRTIGYSYEKRPIKAVEIDWCAVRNFCNVSQMNKTSRPESAPATSTSMGQDIISTLSQSESRNVIFIEGGTHAREWITISVALHCIYELTEKNMRHRDMLRKLRFFIIPVVNPDGYEYSILKNRRWRKNRKPNRNSKTIGTDCNRNYDYHWNEGSTKSHRNIFRGDKPFSEPETRAVDKFLRQLSPYLLFFLSLHSYAQSIMYPWGYTTELPENWKDLEKLARTGSNAIKTYSGRQYRVGSICNLTKHNIYGSVVDYAFGSLKVPLALVMELPAKEYGFQPPPEKISTLGHESWFGIREMCKCAYSLRPPKLLKAKIFKLMKEVIRLEQNASTTTETETTESECECEVQTEKQTIEEK